MNEKNILPKDSTPTYLDECDESISKDARKWWEELMKLYSELEENPKLSASSLASCSDTFVNETISCVASQLREVIINNR